MNCELNKLRKIIGIGETILDIIFKNLQPTAAVPGGSVFNSLISLGRLGMNATLISETGNDRPGNIIMNFLSENGVDNTNVCVYKDGRTPISLAWLNQDNDAEYEFFKDYPKARLDVVWPEISKDDIVMMGSYFVLNPVLRKKTREFITLAHERGAIIYYDFNFRKSHSHEVSQLYPDIMENVGYADIVRGSTEDLDNIFRPLAGSTSPEDIYSKYISPNCQNMICTDGGREVRLFTSHSTLSFPVPQIQTVSTIGAGDNFNAGIVYGLITEDIHREDLPNITPDQWNRIIHHAIQFSSEVCQSFDNYISTGFAREKSEK